MKWFEHPDLDHLVRQPDGWACPGWAEAPAPAEDLLAGPLPFGASPRLYRPAARNLVTNPSAEAASGTVTVRTNLVTNPQPSSETGWIYQLGTGEASATSYVASGGPDPARGFLRRTITTAKSGGNSGFFRNESAASGGSGETVSGALWVRSSHAINVSLNLTCRSGSTNASDADTNLVALVPGVWTLLTETDVSTAAYDNVQLWAILTSGNILPAGATFDIAQASIEKASAPGPYFDGSTPAAGDFTYAWTGAANASTSVQRAPQVVGAPAGPWQTTRPDGKAWRREFTAGQTFPGYQVAAAVPVVAGTTYTVLAEVLSEGTLLTNNVYLQASAASTTIYDIQPATNGQWAARRLVITVPSGVTFMTVAAYVQGTANAAGALQARRIAIIQGDYDGPYFDGDSEGAHWEGAPHASASVLPGAWADGGLLPG